MPLDGVARLYVPTNHELGLDGKSIEESQEDRDVV